DLPRILRIRDVDDVDVGRTVVYGIDEVAVDEGVVHTAGERFPVLRQDLWTGRVIEAENDDSVAPTRCPFPGDDGDRSLGVDLDVVDDAGIHHHRIGQHRVLGRGDVPDVHPVPVALVARPP